MLIYVGYISGLIVIIKCINIQTILVSNVTHLLLQKDVEGQDCEKAKISRHAAAIGILKGQT